MTKAVITEMFGYLAERQEIYGPEGTFQFKSVKISNDIVRAQYRNPIADAEADARHLNRTQKKRANPVEGHVPGPHDPGPVPYRLNQTDNDNRAVRRQHNADGLQNCEAKFVIVDEAVMRKLHSRGIAMPVPCNGPADGPPQYPIPRKVYEAFIREKTVDQDSNQPDNPKGVFSQIDPALLTITLIPTPTPNKGKKIKGNERKRAC